MNYVCLTISLRGGSVFLAFVPREDADNFLAKFPGEVTNRVIRHTDFRCRQDTPPFALLGSDVVGCCINQIREQPLFSQNSPFSMS